MHDQVGEAGGGLAQLVLDCIKLRDRDGVLESETHGYDGTAAWFGSIVLAGGSSMFPGLQERPTLTLHIPNPNPDPYLTLTLTLT